MMQTREEIQQPDGAADAGPNFPPFETETFPPQLIWLVISFVVLYLILARAALPRVARVLSERQDRIADDLDEAERMQAEAKSVQADYEATLQEARAKAQAALNKTRDEIRERTEKRNRELEERLEAKLAEAEERIAKAQSEALESVDDMAREAAAAVIERMTGESPDDKTLRKAVKNARTDQEKAA